MLTTKSVGQSLIFWSNPRTKILKIYVEKYKQSLKSKNMEEIREYESKSEI